VVANDMPVWVKRRKRLGYGLFWMPGDTQWPDRLDTLSLSILRFVHKRQLFSLPFPFD
jgi:hypothetical protein